ncbi:TVP38/TMEM64 family protein [Shumkonia mesophila]|uniref:TVP38/TMEM64 family protein n=1 Tax=Shumkonia mesophila TaxID=2838854 RepID=UPI00293503AA|nr:VTT domain-containing protein [Shumkonia mesophila]
MPNTIIIPPSSRRRRRPLVSAGVGLVILAVIAGAYWSLRETGMLDELAEPARLMERIRALETAGPILVVVLMTVAVVVTPIPSAPIALAVGALYGHTWGTLYVAAGAELGALLAFALARLLGYTFLCRWLGDRLSFSLLGSQWTMMGIVFVSRLLPFLSFDLISYAAGMTPLKAWRFAAATLAGILPASFLLAHFGGEIASRDIRRLAITSAILGGLVVVPILWRLWGGRSQALGK